MFPYLDGTPGRHGFFMPAEFDSHAGCWMLWPEREDNWRCQAEPAQAAYAAVARAISGFEPVFMGVSRQQKNHAARILPLEITLVEMDSDDAWMRDTGPGFVRNPSGEVRGVHWGFNAWGGLCGGLYPSWEKDARVGQKVLAYLGMEGYRAPFILEGGSIHTDGQGTLLTTEECLLNPNRNPSLSRADIESLLRDYLGITTVIWLGKGLFMDETDGHVDNLACFARPGEILLHWTDDPDDPQFEISGDAEKRLSLARDARGRTLTVHRMPQPGPLFRTAEDCLPGGSPPRHPGPDRGPGTRLAASYINFYPANRGIVMPSFNDPMDSRALALIRSLFPDRTVVQVPSREILLGGGGIHCITLQQPAIRTAG